MFVYLYHISGGISETEITNQIEQVDNIQKKEDMYNFIDDLLQKGEKRGIEKGKKIGIEKGRKIAIYEAHLRGGSIDLLSNLFALTAAEIHQIIKEMKKETEDK